MVSTDKNGRYPYSENGWSTGRMRKRGEKPEGEYDVASMIPALRMRPDTSGWGVELERFAGGGLTARGGSTAARAEVTRGAGGLSPEAIQAQKAQTQGYGQQWQLGKPDKKKKKEGRVTKEQLEGLNIFDAIDISTLPVEFFTGKASSEYIEKAFEGLHTLRAKRAKSSGDKEILALDENLNREMVPVDKFNSAEQASRTTQLISQRYSMGKKKAEEPTENMEE